MQPDSVKWPSLAVSGLDQIEICPKSATRFASHFRYLIDSLERETGIEPATFSLGS